MGRNRLKQVRESMLMGIMELSRKANLSYSTLYRVEKGRGCHTETKKKLLRALGIDDEDYEKVFPDD
jgi:predicted transcriptional regulator